MLIKITAEGGEVVDVETSEPALVQIVAVDGLVPDITTFESVAQDVTFEAEPAGPILCDGIPIDTAAADALLNHEVMNDPLNWLFERE